MTSAALFHPITPAASAAGALQHPEYPLVIQVHDATHSRAAGLPQAAIDTLAAARIGDIRHASLGHAMHLYARTETAANEAIMALKKSPGGLLDIVGPEVRYWPGAPACEPVMALEVRMPLLFGAFAGREIVRRRGQVKATVPARRTVTLRAEAPLAALLGFPRWLDALTDGRAELAMRLAGYVPLRSGRVPQ